MKNTHAAGLAVAIGLAVFGVQEWRLAELRKNGSAERGISAEPAQIGSRDPVPERTDAPLPPKQELRAEPEAGQDGEPEAEMAEMTATIRKMSESTAGRAMMNQGIKVAIEMMYRDFIESLNLTDEEAEHFRGLLAAEMAGQQEIGMKLMSTPPEQQNALLEEMDEKSREAEAAIDVFLNSEEDSKRFRKFKEQAPERQQMDGVRAVMTERGVTMDKATETKLVEAMHEARTAPGTVDLQGISGLREIFDGDAVEVFEKSWESQQASLRESTGFLAPEQREAFLEYQRQMRGLQLANVRMAEKMMKGNGRSDGTE